MTAAQAGPWSGKEPQFNAPVPAAIDDWATTAQQGNLAVQAAQIAQRLAEMDIDKEQAGHLPTLDLIAAHGRSALMDRLIGSVADRLLETVGTDLLVVRPPRR